MAFGVHGAIMQCGDAHLEVVKREVDVLALGEHLGRVRAEGRTDERADEWVGWRVDAEW